MPIQAGSAEEWITAMQQQMRSTPQVADQQEVIASQKALSASLEQVAAAMEAAGADKKTVELLEEAKKSDELTLEAINKLIDAVKEAKELSYKQSEAMQDALDNYISDSTDQAIQTRTNLDRQLKTPIETILSRLDSQLELAKEDKLFAEDKERQESKKREGLIGKFFDWAERVYTILENFWNKYGPGWEDLWKIAWALWAPQILKAIKWGVEHLSEIGHFKVLVDIAKHAKTLSKLGPMVKSGILAIKNIPKSISEMFKASKIGKAVGELAEAFKSTNMFKKGAQIAEFIKGTPAFQHFEMSVKWAETMVKQGVRNVQKFFFPVKKAARSVSKVLQELSLQARLGMMEVRTNLSKVATAGEKIAKVFRNNPVVKDLRVLGNAFKNVGVAVGETFFPAISKSFKAFTQGTGRVVHRLRAFGKLLDKADKVKGMFNAFGKAGKGLNASISPVTKMIANLTKPIRGMAKAFRMVGRAFGPLMIAIDAIVGFLRTETTETGLKGIFDKLRGAIANVIAGFGQLIELIWNLAMDGLAKIPGIGKWFENIKMTDQGVSNFSAHLMGMNAYTAEDGKIHYETLKHQHEREAGDELGDSDTGGSWASRLGRRAWSHKNGIGYVKGRDGRCAKYVRENIQNTLGAKVANQVRSASAYMMADKFKNNPEPRKFWDFLGNKKHTELKNLPAGSVVVWPRAGKSKHGHVEISDGQGHLISDYARPATNVMYRSPNLLASVFTPKGTSPMMSTASDKPTFSSSINDGPSAMNRSAGSDNPETYEDTEASTDSMQMEEEQEPYSMANAIQDIIKMSSALGGSNAEADAIYGRASKGSTKSAPAFGGGSGTAQSSTPDQQKSAPPVIALQEQPAYNLPQIDDQIMLYQQMALPTG